MNILPPRAPGYRQTRELFSGYTGMPFDPLGAAETAASITIEAILHPDRAARMVEYHARSREIPGLADLLDTVIAATWKSLPASGLNSEIQRVVNNVVLVNLMRLVGNERTSAQVRAQAALKLNELKDGLNKKIDTTEDTHFKSHFFYAVSQIDLFQKDPSKVKLGTPLTAPPGAPIGN